MDDTSQRIILYETKVSIVFSILINLVWWGSVHGLGISFPFLHFVLLFFVLSFLPQWDKRFYGETTTGIEVLRAGTNMLIFFAGMILIGPFGTILQTSVPMGFVQFLFATISIASILSIARASTNLVMIISNTLG